jgi:hypothetical protein
MKKVKIIVMEQTTKLIFPSNKQGLIVPPEFEMKQTKDGINYLIKYEEV